MKIILSALIAYVLGSLNFSIILSKTANSERVAIAP